MPRDKQPDHEPGILDKLFGEPADLANDELDMLYSAMEPDADPAAKIRSLAEAAAIRYRLQNKMPPDHVQAALDATREVSTLDNVPTSKLRQIVDSIKAPFTGAVHDPAFAYRNRDGELDSNDQAIMDNFTDELEEDWEDARRNLNEPGGASRQSISAAVCRNVARGPRAVVQGPGIKNPRGSCKRLRRCAGTKQRPSERNHRREGKHTRSFP
jgi:hypothetical protein